MIVKFSAEPLRSFGLVGSWLASLSSVLSKTDMLSSHWNAACGRADAPRDGILWNCSYIIPRNCLDR
jgi:hypothetical protein